MSAEAVDALVALFKVVGRWLIALTFFNVLLAIGLIMNVLRIREINALSEPKEKP